MTPEGSKRYWFARNIVFGSFGGRPITILVPGVKEVPNKELSCITKEELKLFPKKSIEAITEAGIITLGLLSFEKEEKKFSGSHIIRKANCTRRGG